MVAGADLDLSDLVLDGVERAVDLPEQKHGPDEPNHHLVRREHLDKPAVERLPHHLNLRLVGNADGVLRRRALVLRPAEHDLLPVAEEMRPHATRGFG